MKEYQNQYETHAESLHHEGLHPCISPKDSSQREKTPSLTLRRRSSPLDQSTSEKNDKSTTKNYSVSPPILFLHTTNTPIPQEHQRRSAPHTSHTTCPDIAEATQHLPALNLSTHPRPPPQGFRPLRRTPRDRDLQPLQPLDVHHIILYS